MVILNLYLKVTFFSLQSPTKIFQITILNFEFPAHNNLFKIQVQDSDLDYIIWRFEKRISLSEKRYLYGISLYVAVDFGLGIQIYSSTQQCCPRFHC